MNQRDINRRVEQFKKAGERETLKPPPIISMPGKTSGSKGIDIRRAKLTADAGANDSITANLYNSKGVEQTEGDEAGVTVFCHINKPDADLKHCIPKLQTGGEILVIKLPYENTNGMLVDRWYCANTIFQFIGMDAWDGSHPSLLYVDAGMLRVGLTICDEE